MARSTQPFSQLQATAASRGRHVQVRQIDRADNKSEAIGQTFHAGPGGFSSPEDGSRTARHLSLVSEAAAAKCNAVTFPRRSGVNGPFGACAGLSCRPGPCVRIRS
ncbi:hypothetical protein [Streptomyces wuyuanensis]|uniref:hypothetical protein n=1 Tax=Streptomyces wuyuanensis TaxID=1196353 RepID=UPI0034268355